MIRATAGALAHGGGAAVGLDDGRVAFVRDACPGDEAEIEIVADHGRWVDARLVRVLTPSPDRVAPPCPYAGECGGCQWQHVSATAQLDAKRSIVKDAFERIGRLEGVAVRPCVPSPHPLGYRNKIELVAEDAGRDIVLGYHRYGSDSLVAVDRCLLLASRHVGVPKALRGALRYLGGRHGDLGIRRVGIRVASHTRDVEVALWTTPGPFPRALAAKTLTDAVGATGVMRVMTKGPDKERRIAGVEVLSGRGAWRERLGGTPFLISAPSFFQVNTGAAELLVRLVIDALEPVETDRVLDLFAGAGTFTLPLAGVAGEVVAVESSRHALADLRRNLEIEDLFADVVGGDAARELPALDEFDLAIVDPPRSGLDGQLIPALAQAGPRRIAYVSCEPATLARDAARLVAEGYTPVLVQPVDLFPQTYHVETVAVFERRPTG